MDTEILKQNFLIQTQRERIHYQEHHSQKNPIIFIPVKCAVSGQAHTRSRIIRLFFDVAAAYCCCCC